MKTVVKELNAFLEGNYMAIHAYENYIQHLHDSELRTAFQKIQQNHKHHAAIIAERIQNLGGVPVDDVGIKGAIVEFAKKAKGSSNDPQLILKDALNGENRGIEVSKELVKGDLDSESLELVNEILGHDQEHVDLLMNISDPIK